MSQEPETEGYPSIRYPEDEPPPRDNFGNWLPDHETHPAAPGSDGPVPLVFERMRPQKQAVSPSVVVQPFGPAERDWELAAAPAAVAQRSTTTGRVVRELVETLLLAVLVFLAVRASVQHYRVEGHSMDPTLADGEFMLVNTLAYSEVNVDKLARFVPFWDPGKPDVRHIFQAPKRGEIIILHDPTPRHGPDLVKRVIGLPGDRVEVFGGHVYINGRELHEPYIKKAWDSGNQPPVVLGAGEFWVMGDNRNNSLDSRVFGPIADELIVGKAMFSWWPRATIGLAPNKTPTLDKAVTRP
jgi:signal peptidase I